MLCYDVSDYCNMYACDVKYYDVSDYSLVIYDHLVIYDSSLVASDYSLVISI